VAQASPAAEISVLKNHICQSIALQSNELQPDRSATCREQYAPILRYQLPPKPHGKNTYWFAFLL
jgi:hypothetical protein